MELFDGDTDKIKALEQKIADEMGFKARRSGLRPDLFP